jgi:hypothetical protein
VPDSREPRECTIEELSRRTPLEIGDEADPTGTALTSRVVEEVLLFAHPGFTFRSKEETPADCF